VGPLRVFSAFSPSRRPLCTHTPRQYVRHAVRLGVAVEFVRATGRFPNTHGVPPHVVDDMWRRMEALDVGSVLEALTPAEEEAQRRAAANPPAEPPTSTSGPAKDPLSSTLSEEPAVSSGVEGRCGRGEGRGMERGELAQARAESGAAVVAEGEDEVVLAPSR
jgi:hypothetical protein